MKIQGALIMRRVLSSFTTFLSVRWGINMILVNARRDMDLLIFKYIKRYRKYLSGVPRFITPRFTALHGRCVFTNGRQDPTTSKKIRTPFIVEVWTGNISELCL